MGMPTEWADLAPEQQNLQFRDRVCQAELLVCHIYSVILQDQQLLESVFRDHARLAAFWSDSPTGPSWRALPKLDIISVTRRPMPRAPRHGMERRRSTTRAGMKTMN